jgi:4-hydroxy-3-methylbut-2-enyl diphosphate reductase
LELIDASCPVVLKLQNRIKNSYDKKDNIYIYGKHGHAEVIGLLGQTDNKAVVFQDLEELDLATLPKNITLYSQTTKSTDKFYQITGKLAEAGVSVEVNDTICRQVSNRDKELRDFAKNFDKIMFVSGSKSSNGKVLYNVCKDTNPQTYFISKTEDLSRDWFLPGEKVGICGATSTPMWLMEQVRDKMLTF